MASVSTKASCSNSSDVDGWSFLAGRMNFERMPPSMWTPMTCSSSQQFGFPFWLAKLSGLFMYGSTEHRCPGCTFSTPSPTASTSTPSSWPGNCRVRVERHLAQVAAVIGSANADAMHLNEGFAGARFAGFVNVDDLELFRFR